MDSKPGNLDSKTKFASVSLKRYANLGQGWRFYALPKAGTRIRTDAVLIDGQPIECRAGVFYLDYRQNGKRVQRPVGSSPRAALEALRIQRELLAGKFEQHEEHEVATESGSDTTVKDACAAYLRDVEASKGEDTIRDYRLILDTFQSSTRKRFVHELKRADIIAILAEGRKNGQSQATVNKKAMITLSAMRRAGAEIKMLRGDWPKIVDRAVEVYTAEELAEFFAHCDRGERLIFQTFLCSGFRDRELSTLPWSDVDFKEGTLAVKARPQYRFTPKSYQERALPVPRSLIAELKRWRKENPDAVLVFPTPPHPKRPSYGGEKPNAHHLELCKQIAFRAGLNCRKCVTAKGKCSAGPHCRHFYLHRFRSTFASETARSMDIRTLQRLLGHSSIVITERYLAGVRGSALREQIESGSLAALISR